jgi:hypothetical protein
MTWNKPVHILSHLITRQACRPCFIEGTGTLKSSKKGVLREAKAGRPDARYGVTKCVVK